MSMKMVAVSQGHHFWVATASPLSSFIEKQNVRILADGVPLSFVLFGKG